MADWEKKELEWTYDYSKRVFEKQIHIEKAKDELVKLMPKRSKDSFGMYIDMYASMRQGKAIRRSASKDMFVYYIRHIYEDNPNSCKNAIIAVKGYITYGYQKNHDKKTTMLSAIKELDKEYQTEINWDDVYVDADVDDSESQIDGLNENNENDNSNSKKTLEKTEKQLLSVNSILNHINNYMQSKGFAYDSNLIANFYLSLRAKPFVILAGTSGTGKTKLVELFAEAIDATPDNGRLLLVPVRPDWSDSTDLLGHMNLNGEFVPGAITDFVFNANSDPNNSYFLCLDEMNLARVEYYLSDILSIIETRKIREDGRIASLPLFTKNAFNNDTKIEGTDTLAKSKYENICLSENLFIIGTVNMDETTFPFSKKVLDRANTIEFSKVDTLVPDYDKIFKAKQDCTGPLREVTNDFLRAKYTKIEECSEKRETVIKDCEILQTLNLILEEAEAHVGFRVRDEIVFYLLYSREIYGDDSIDTAFDNEIMQKILPRIQGSGMDILKLLENLIDFCGNKYPKSKAKLEAMKARCGEYGEGYTSYWL